MQDPLPDLSGADDLVIALVPWKLTPAVGVKAGRDFANLPLDKLHWPLGRPSRTQGLNVGDLRSDDHLIIQPNKLSRQFTTLRRGTRAQYSLMLMEPRPILGIKYLPCRLNAWRFHSILLHDLDGFGQRKKTVFVAHGGTWVPEWRQLDVSKSKNTSLIASAKRDLQGHQLRHDVATLCKTQSLDVDVIGRGYKPFKDKADGLAPYRFSVVIENCRINNYFTEKLVDSFLCETVPIYWGAPNIDEFFDPESMIICETLEDVQAAIEQANTGLYEKILPKLHAQKPAAAHFANLKQRSAFALYEYIMGTKE